MNRKIRYAILFLSSIFILNFYTVIYYRDLLYVSDMVKSYIIALLPMFSQNSSGYTIMNSDSLQKYTNIYGNLPEQFLHSGDILFYRTKRSSSIQRIAELSLKYTHYFRKYQLVKALKQFNGISEDIVPGGSTIIIPYALPTFILDLKKTAKPKLIHSRGLYFTGSTAGNERILANLDRYIKRGINTIVFDAKDITGIVNYRSHLPDVVEFNTHGKRTIDDLSKLIRKLKSKNIYTIARIAVFRDHLLFKIRPDYAIHSRKNGKPWNANSGELWCDPSNRHVQDYNIALAVELAETGVDEIQFDYIRFPTTGDLNDAGYAYHFGRMPKDAVITQFLKRAYEEISRRNTLLSIDIFGVVAWEKKIDIMRTGQRIELLSRYCDVISPMVYPSHFNDGFDGHSNPGDSPYHFVYQGCKKVKELARGTAVRPWLQAFNWRASTFGEDYILKQIKAANDSGAKGYLFWNARNEYNTVYSALARLNRKKENEIKSASLAIK